MDHRYESTGDPNQTQVLDGPDLNHFSSDYFGHGQHWDNPDLAHSEESYRIARAEYERDGRRIIDATLDGACDIFEKVDHRRSEEHTSELQSLMRISYAVFCLKKKKKITTLMSLSTLYNS